METLATTQTGIPFMDCGDCGRNHPATRRHCGGCGAPSLFLNTAGACLRCAAAPVCGATYCDLEDGHAGGHALAYVAAWQDPAPRSMPHYEGPRGVAGNYYSY